jgi:hypothetical protein
MLLEAGPLLQELLDVHEADRQALEYPAVSQWVDALVAASAARGGPVLWPAGAGAERLAGAAVLASAGRVRIWSGHDRVDGQHVAVLALHMVGPTTVAAGVDAARAAGATRIDIIAISVPDADTIDGVDRVIRLGAGSSNTVLSKERAWAGSTTRRSA